MSNLSQPDRVKILDALSRPGPFWFHGIVSIVARARWSKLADKYQLDQSNYGTLRVLERNRDAGRNTISYLIGPVETDMVVVEALPSYVAARYRGLGLDFYLPSEITSHVINSLNRALSVIAEVEGVALAVSSVLSVLHVLKPESAEFDVSYSEPDLPFSIFIGVAQGEYSHRGDLRLVESILHECMHLQLTLIEEQTPLLSEETEAHFSPWRGAMRPTRGVFHALYVFRVIQDFFAELLDRHRLGNEDQEYLLRRIIDIDTEIAELQDLSDSKDLNATGRALACRLLAGHKDAKFSRPRLAFQQKF